MPMVIPGGEHRLIKIRKVNRKRLLRYAIACSFLATVVGMTGSMTDNWLYTQEVLRYFVLPNATLQHEEFGSSEVYWKNATLGPWHYCWADPLTEHFCELVNYDQDDDPADVTSGVQQGVRKAFIFMISGVFLDVLGTISCLICNLRSNTYATLFICTVLHILAGIANFACIIVYMSAVSKEVVGNKMFPATEMDEPLFHYQYGYSFIMLKISFLLTEVAALFSVVVFMAKRDERTFHRFKIRSLLSTALSPRKTDNAGIASPNGRISPVHSSTQSTLPPTPSTEEEEEEE
ncbi:hypothetical protein PENTCL1PPCAC_5450, partial [Pristionchus entomophagus]